MENKLSISNLTRLPQKELEEIVTQTVTDNMNHPNYLLVACCHHAEGGCNRGIGCLFSHTKKTMCRHGTQCRNKDTWCERYHTKEEVINDFLKMVKNEKNIQDIDAELDQGLKEVSQLIGITDYIIKEEKRARHIYEIRMKEQAEKNTRLKEECVKELAFLCSELDKLDIVDKSRKTIRTDELDQFLEDIQEKVHAINEDFQDVYDFTYKELMTQQIIYETRLEIIAEGCDIV
jgi:hypothetical protein